MKLNAAFSGMLFLFAASGFASAEEMVEGTIKKIDAAQNKITIKHAELKALEMPPMTMVFAAGEGVDISKLEEGQKIKFLADRVNGRITVTAIE